MKTFKAPKQDVELNGIQGITKKLTKVKMIVSLAPTAPSLYAAFQIFEKLATKFNAFDFENIISVNSFTEIAFSFFC